MEKRHIITGNFYVSALKAAFITFASTALVRTQSLGNTELPERLKKSPETKKQVSAQLIMSAK